MAVLSHKFQRLLKKVLSFKIADHHHIGAAGYEKLEVGKDEMKRCCAPRGYVPIYVGDEMEPKILYQVPTAAFNSPAFVGMLDEYGDDIGARGGPLSVPCSAVAFEHVLRRALIA